MQRVQQVNLEEEPVSNVISIKRYPFDKGYVSHIDRFSVVWIPPIRGGERVVNRYAKFTNIQIY